MQQTPSLQQPGAAEKLLLLLLSLLCLFLPDKSTQHRCSLPHFSQSLLNLLFIICSNLEYLKFNNIKKQGFFIFFLPALGLPFITSRVPQYTTVGFDTATAVAIKYYRVWLPFLFQTQTAANVAGALQLSLWHRGVFPATRGTGDRHGEPGEGADVRCCHDPPREHGQNLWPPDKATPTASQVRYVKKHRPPKCRLRPEHPPAWDRHLSG